MQYSLLKSREYDVSCGSDGDGSDIRGYYGADNPRGLSLGANVLQAVLSETMVVEITATGGVLLLGIGLSMLEVKQVKVANFAGVGGSSFAGCIMGTVWSWFVERGSWRIRKQPNTSLQPTRAVARGYRGALGPWWGLVGRVGWVEPRVRLSSKRYAQGESNELQSIFRY